MSDYKHLRGVTMLEYAEKHLSKDIVRELKKDIRDCHGREPRTKSDYYDNLAYRREVVEIGQRNAEKKYRDYRSYVGDKRSKEAVSLRKSWAIACLGLLYGEFILCWTIENLENLKQES
jgi:hypothetical protein